MIAAHDRKTISRKSPTIPFLTNTSCLCARKTKGPLQRDRAAVDRPRASAAHSADWLFVRHHQRTEVSGTAHASGVRWFTGLGFDQEIPHHSTFSKKPARAVPGIETVRAVVRTDRETVRGSGAGARESFPFLP